MIKKQGFFTIAIAISSLIMSFYLSGAVRYGEYDSINIPDFSELKIDRIQKSQIKEVQDQIKHIKLLDFSSTAEDSENYVSMFEKDEVITPTYSGGVMTEEVFEEIYVLTMTFKANDTAKAVIDGKLYKVGDTLWGEEKILAINSYSVLISIGGDERTLYLNDDKGVVDTTNFDDFKVRQASN